VHALIIYTVIVFFSHYDLSDASFPLLKTSLSLSLSCLCCASSDFLFGFQNFPWQTSSSRRWTTTSRPTVKTRHLQYLPIAARLHIATRLVIHTSSSSSRFTDTVISGICDFVCVRALMGKWLELPTPNLADIQCTAVAQPWDQKVKVTWLSGVLSAWVCMSIGLLRCLVMRCETPALQLY